MRKTKIVCTIGPVTQSEEMIKKLMEHGMDVARFNFSHGSYEYHKDCIEKVRKVASELNLPVAAMMDTKGPEVRLGRFVDDKPVEIKNGDIYTLTTEDCLCTDKVGSITFKKLPADVSVGTRILINDGVIELLAEKVTATEIECRVIHGGKLSNNKGINVPGVKLSMPYLSDADMNDLEFAAKMKYDFIAASFVRTAADINYLRKYTQSLGWFDVRIIAKIENLEGVENIDEILEAADGIMVARGDMGVEVEYERLPGLQKKFIRKCYQAGKVVITATQMLESMIHSLTPTRAEITDVANAVFDGTSAIMLSGETAMGDHPDKVVKTMAKIARQAENDALNLRVYDGIPHDNDIDDTTNAICDAACTTARDLNAKVIIAVTQSGHTARCVSKYRPDVPIVAPTPNSKTYHQLSLSWGVYPVKALFQTNTNQLFDHAIACAKMSGYVNKNDRVVITAGENGITNILNVQIVKSR